MNLNPDLVVYIRKSVPIPVYWNRKLINQNHRMKRKVILLSLLCSFTFSFLSAQQKFEKETRIKLAQVPLSAQQFIAAIPFSKEIKWYKEEGLTTSSYEAKTRYNQHKYSIEFDTLGQLEDVEIKIKWAAVPKPIQTAIQQHLMETFDRFKYSKVQEQLSGETAAVLDYLLGKGKKESIITQYEIVLKGKKEGQTRWFEYTFDAQGKLQQQNTIIFRNTDNLEY